jgi:uncharacterized protein
MMRRVWVSLKVRTHFHCTDAQVIFTRYTQIGLLRLMTNPVVMGPETMTMQQAWKVYDFWVDDPRIDMHPEPRGLEEVFRDATQPFALRSASKWAGDCYLPAYADTCGATLVTFDKGLLELARKGGYAAISPV